MSEDRHTRASEIFLLVCDLDPKLQAQRLAAECGQDPELEALVEGMLAADNAGGRSFDQPAAVQYAPGFRDASGSEPPLKIAHFRILRELGRGGMGIVYEAEQEYPQRTVALKLVRSVLASSEILRRFEHEAEMLGWLSHPGIAQIYEAGVAPSSEGPQPYYAMEIVRGQPLTQFAAENELGLDERLSLMERISRAVHHAHQKGIVHRDLKPSNILVGPHGPKILDFGIARAIDVDPEASFVTRTGDLLGTISYMSPEQMSSDPAQLDTRSDVYSLGVLGYELVTGRLPQELNQVPLPEAMRRLRDEDPERPAKLVPGLPSDVETILNKALAKRKEERYSSAEALADDLRRFLDQQPIAAHPPSTFYYVRKFANRNRVLVGAAGAIALVLTVATVISSLAAVGQARAARLAEQRRIEAERQTAVARAINDFLNGDLLGAIDPDRQGRDVTMLEVLDAAAANVKDRFEDEPLVEAEIRYTIGNCYMNLGQQELAAPFFQRTLELREELLGERHPDTITSYNGLGRLMLRLGRHEDAERYLRRCLELRREVLGRDAELTLITQNNLAGLHRQQGRWEEALALYRDAEELAAVAFGPDHVTNLNLLEGRAGIYKDTDRPELAIPLYERVLEAHRRLAPGKQNEARALNNLALAYMNNDRLGDAELYFAEALELFVDLLGEEHPSTLVPMGNLARALEKQGDFELAEPLFERALELNRELNGNDHRGTLIVMQYRADMDRHRGRLAAAESTLLELHGLAVQRYGSSFPGALRSREALIELYEAWGKPAEAALWRKKDVQARHVVNGRPAPDPD